MTGEGSEEGIGPRRSRKIFSRKKAQKIRKVERISSPWEEERTVALFIDAPFAFLRIFAAELFASIRANADALELQANGPCRA
jgi:hypothetical protein